MPRGAAAKAADRGPAPTARKGGCRLIIKTVNDKLTSYFPPSPAPEEPVDQDEEIATAVTIKSEPKEETVSNPSDIPTPDSTPTKDKSVSVSASSTPHKIQLVTDNTNQTEEQDSCLGKENCSTNTQSAQCKHSLPESDLSQRTCDSPKPTQPKLSKCNGTEVPTMARKGRKGRARQRRPVTGKPTNQTTAVAQTKPKSAPQNRTSQKKPVPEPNQNLLTDYFPIRRSARRTQSDLKKDKQAELEKAILEERTEGLKVENIPNKGRGVLATQPFSRGDFVVEYVGDLISLGNAKEREKSYAANPEFGCYMYYFTHNNKSYCLDATAESGKLGRLLNHSCKTPNCQTKVVAIDGHPYLILIAARDIQVGEELLYDYGDRSKESLAAHPWLAL